MGLYVNPLNKNGHIISNETNDLRLFSSCQQGLAQWKMTFTCRPEVLGSKFHDILVVCMFVRNRPLI